MYSVDRICVTIASMCACLKVLYVLRNESHKCLRSVLGWRRRAPERKNDAKTCAHKKHHYKHFSFVCGLSRQRQPMVRASAHDSCSRRYAATHLPQCHCNGCLSSPVRIPSFFFLYDPDLVLTGTIIWAGATAAVHGIIKCRLDRCTIYTKERGAFCPPVQILNRLLVCRRNDDDSDDDNAR